MADYVDGERRLGTMVNRLLSHTGKLENNAQEEQ